MRLTLAPPLLPNFGASSGGRSEADNIGGNISDVAMSDDDAASDGTEDSGLDSNDIGILEISDHQNRRPCLG